MLYSYYINNNAAAENLRFRKTPKEKIIFRHYQVGAMYITEISVPS